MINNISIKKKSDIEYVSFNHFEQTTLVSHCFMTRVGGVSEGAYSTLNPGLTTQDDTKKIAKNREKISEVIGFKLSESIELEHGNKVHIIRKKEDNDGSIIADAVITNLKKEPLVILYADCVPVFILDPVTPAIALIHAGWRGTVLKIVTETVMAMQKEFNTNPSDCLAGIAPSIGKCCFEIGEDVAKQFVIAFEAWKDLEPYLSNESTNKHTDIQNINNKFYVDLWNINKRLLIQSGLLDSNISVAGLCTSCRKDLFYSYRRDKKITGRMAAVLTLI